MASGHRSDLFLKRSRAIALIGTAAALVVTATAALATSSVSATRATKPENVLYNFTGGNDGYNPTGGLIADKAGNLYGTAYGAGCLGQGTVFKLSPDGTETTLHCFTETDGAAPMAVMILDRAGNLFGTTYAGGDNDVGTVFKLTPDGTETVLHSFSTGNNDGYLPISSLLNYKSALYGTAARGGTTDNGAVFKLTLSGTETVLYSFKGGTKDGWDPWGTPLVDDAGNLYGTTLYGGAYNAGIVFELTPRGKEKVLYTFQGGNGGSDGYGPVGTLIWGKSGNLYGTTQLGGIYNSGTIYKLAPDGTETVLYTFTGGNDGFAPSGSLLPDSAGNFYSTAQGGGTAGDGTVFKLAPSGILTVLHTFAGGSDGAAPYFIGLIKDSANAKGYLFGTTVAGGTSDFGTVFNIKQ